MKSSIIIGLLSALSGALAIAVAWYLYFNAHLVETTTENVSPSVLSLTGVTVDTTNLLQVSARLTVETTHRKQIHTSDGIEHRPLYKIPLSLTVRNDQDEVVHTERKIFNSSGLISTVEFADNRLIVTRSINFSKFESSDSLVSANLVIETDEEYAATVTKATLTIYDNVFHIAHFVKFGVPLVFLGFIIVMYGWTTGSTRNSHATAIILAALGGALGLDRFYLGYFWYGVLKLLTFGGCGIWALIDFVLIVLRKVPDANGNELE